MANRKELKSKNIDEVKQEVINSSLVVAASIGAITYLISISRLFTVGFHYTYITEFLIVLLLAITSVYRNKLSIAFKTYFLIGIIFLFSLSDALNFGLFSTAKIYMVLLPLFAVLFLTFTQSIVLLTMALASFLAIGYLFYTGVLTMPENYAPENYSQRYYPFVINALHLLVLALIILAIIQKFLSAYRIIISELKLNNQVIAEREKNYRNIFDSSGDAIFVLTPEGEITNVNHSVYNMYGFEKKEVLEKHWSFFGSKGEENTHHQFIDYIEKAINNEPVLFEWLASNKKGKDFWVEVSLRKTTIDGELKILAMVRDINLKKRWALKLQNYNEELEYVVKERTEELQAAVEELSAINDELNNQRLDLEKAISKLKQTQQQLIQSEKMASLGIMAAGVAHEINNPVNYIHGGITIIEQFLEENNRSQLEELKPYIDGINLGVERTVNIVNTLSQYSQSEKLPLSPCNVNKILDEALIILNQRISSGMVIKKEFTREEYKLISNPGKLLQIFMNIIDNAIFAIKDHGEILIKTAVTNKYIFVQVTDNGIGIKENNLKKVFDPFYTTKEPGKGTGLGLSITYNLINELNGTIQVKSEEGKGTDVQVKFMLDK